MKQNQNSQPSLAPLAPSLAQNIAAASKVQATILAQSVQNHNQNRQHSVSSAHKSQDPSQNWSDQFSLQQKHQQQQPLLVRPAFAPPRMHPGLGFPAPFAFVPRYASVTTVAAPVEEQKPGAEERLSGEDMEAARRMAERLRSEPDFQNSEFLRFVDGLTSGQVRFEDNKVVDASGREVNLNELLDTPPPDNYESSMDRIYREMQAEDPTAFPDFRSTNATLYRPPQELEYPFRARNRFLEDERDLATVAGELQRGGRMEEAIEALESHLRVQTSDAETWRRLGALHASRDEDTMAIKCFQKAHNLDPYDSENLLALGVALTNELDAFRALDTLRLWLMSREEYFALMAGTSDYLDAGNLSQDLVEALSKAAQTRTGTSDADVHTALGVVHNINKNFKLAAMSFLNACALKAGDASLWNKLGATLANGGFSDAALLAYAHALELEPGFVRAWSNLGIARLNKEQPEMAVRCFAEGLRLHPEANNLWSTLFLTCTNFLGDNEALTEAAVSKNFSEISIQLSRPEQLPAPVSLQNTIDSIKTQLQG